MKKIKKKEKFVIFVLIKHLNKTRLIKNTNNSLSKMFKTKTKLNKINNHFFKKIFN